MKFVMVTGLVFLFLKKKGRFFRSALMVAAPFVLLMQAGCVSSTVSELPAKATPVEVNFEPEFYRIKAAPSIYIPAIMDRLISLGENAGDLDVQFVGPKEEGENSELDVFTGVGVYAFDCPHEASDIPRGLWLEICEKGKIYKLYLISGVPLTFERKKLPIPSREDEKFRLPVSSLKSQLTAGGFEVSNWSNAYANDGARHFPYPYDVFAARKDNILIIGKDITHRSLFEPTINRLQIYLFSNGDA